MTANLVRSSFAEQATSSTVGWLHTTDGAPCCLFCGQPARWWKPQGWTDRLWWCPPCETTWVSTWAA